MIIGDFRLGIGVILLLVSVVVFVIFIVALLADNGEFTNRNITMFDFTPLSPDNNNEGESEENNEEESDD